MNDWSLFMETIRAEQWNRDHEPLYNLHAQSPSLGGIVKIAIPLTVEEIRRLRDHLTDFLADGERFGEPPFPPAETKGATP